VMEADAAHAAVEAEVDAVVVDNYCYFTLTNDP